MNVRLEILRGGTIEDESALMENHDPGGQGLDLLGPVRGKKYRLP